MSAKVTALQTRLTGVQKQITELEAKLVKARATEVELTTQITTAQSTGAQQEAIDAGLPSGTVVVFTYGRADTKKELTGVVQGTKPQEKGGALYRISSGEGFDLQTYTVSSAFIVAYQQGDAVPAEPATVAPDPLADLGADVQVSA